MGGLLTTLDKWLSFFRRYVLRNERLGGKPVEKQFVSVAKGTRDGKHFRNIELEIKGFVIKDEDGIFSSFCPSLEIYTQGDTEKEAKDNLKEAVELFIEFCDDENILDKELKDLGWHKVDGKITEPKKEGVTIPPYYGKAKPFFIPTMLPELRLAS